MAYQTKLYRHYSADGRLLYVGISISVLARLTQHRRQSVWFNDIARIEIEEFPTKREALKAEREAIRTERPMWNWMHQKPVPCKRKKCPTFLYDDEFPPEWERAWKRVHEYAKQFPQEDLDAFAAKLAAARSWNT